MGYFKENLIIIISIWLTEFFLTPRKNVTVPPSSSLSLSISLSFFVCLNIPSLVFPDYWVIPNRNYLLFKTMAGPFLIKKKKLMENHDTTRELSFYIILYLLKIFTPPHPPPSRILFLEKERKCNGKIFEIKKGKLLLLFEIFQQTN